MVFLSREILDSVPVFRRSAKLMARKTSQAQTTHVGSHSSGTYLPLSNPVRPIRYAVVSISHQSDQASHPTTPARRSGPFVRRGAH